MRDRDTIDSELRLLAAERRSIRERGGELSTSRVDELLDERLGHRPERSEKPRQLMAVRPRPSLTHGRDAMTITRSRRGRKNVFRRFGLLAALPLSVIGLAALLVVAFAVRNAHPAAQPTEVPPSDAQPEQAAPKPIASPPGRAPTADHAGLTDIVDNAYVDALKQQGVPVPSREYVTSHGHAVCDFLAHQPDFAEAARFVQRSSIWDADQSTEVVAGAVVSYCPQYQPAAAAQLPQTFQKTLSDLQAIEGDLQGIRGDLPGG